MNDNSFKYKKTEMSGQPRERQKSVNGKSICLRNKSIAGYNLRNKQSSALVGRRRRSKEESTWPAEGPQAAGAAHLETAGSTSVQGDFEAIVHLVALSPCLPGRLPATVHRQRAATQIEAASSADKWRPLAWSIHHSIGKQAIGHSSRLVQYGKIAAQRHLLCNQLILGEVL